VLRGTFKRVEHVLIAACSVFVAYVFAAVLAHPDWGAAARGLVVPTLPATNEALLAATAVVGTTLAPWGLAFIQSYAVDKRLHPRDLGYERVDVVTGALLTGIVGLFVVVACAATLHVQGRSIEDAADAAVALEPVAGRFASTLFAAGLLGAGLIAAAILPLSTGYSVSEMVGSEAALDDSFRDAPLFYSTYFVVIAAAVGLVVAPAVPLVQVLYLTQALNAILLVPLLVLVLGLARDRELMGVHALGRKGTALTGATIVLIGACVAALGVFSAAG
jgi:Mn2+/Fe2+ NRAMP family transporter